MSRKKGPITFKDLQDKVLKKGNPLKDRPISQKIIGVTDLLFPSSSSSKLNLSNDEWIKREEDKNKSTDINHDDFIENKSPVVVREAQDLNQSIELKLDDTLKKGFLQKDISKSEVVSSLGATSFYRLPYNKTLNLIRSLDKNQFVIYLFISLKAWQEFSNSPGLIKVSINYISQGLNIAPATTKRSFNDLVRKGHLKCLKQDFKTGNTYQITDDLKQLAANGEEGKYFKLSHASKDLMKRMNASNFITFLYMTMLAFDRGKYGLLDNISSEILSKGTNTSRFTIEQSISFLQDNSYIEVISRNKKSGSIFNVFPLCANIKVQTFKEEESFHGNLNQQIHLKKNKIKKVVKTNIFSPETEIFLKRYSLTKMVLKREREALTELIISGKDESEILLLAKDLLGNKTLNNDDCDRPFSYLASGPYEKVLRRAKGVKDFDPIKIYTAISRFSTREPLPKDFSESLTSKELEWIQINGGRLTLGQWPESKLKKELRIL